MKLNRIGISVLLTLCAVVILCGCNSKEETSSISSYIKVLGKGSDNNQFWIEVQDPNAENKIKYKISVEPKMVWNIIEIDKEYFATYDVDLTSSDGKLVDIKLPAEVKDDKV